MTAINTSFKPVLYRRQSTAFIHVLTSSVYLIRYAYVNVWTYTKHNGTGRHWKQSVRKINKSDKRIIAAGFTDRTVNLIWRYEKISYDLNNEKSQSALSIGESSTNT